MGTLPFKDFVVIDCETTYVKEYGQLPIEMGAIRYRDEHEIERFSSLANSGFPVTQTVEELTGITNDELKKAPDLNTVLQSFLSFVGDEPLIIGHNIKYDYSAILAACQFCHIPGPDWSKRTQDTMTIAANVFRHNSLANCAKWLGIEQCPAHRAVNDSKTTAELFLALQKESNRIENDTKNKQRPFIGTRFSHVPEVGFAFSRIEERQTSDYISPREKYLKKVQEIIDNAQGYNIDFTDIHFAFHGNLEKPSIMRIGGLDRIVEALGGTFHKNVSSKVDFYVCFDNEETETVQKAKRIAEDPKNHLQIIDGADFLEMLAFETDEPNREDVAQVRLRKNNERREKEEVEKNHNEKANERKEKKTLHLSYASEHTALMQGKLVIQLLSDGKIVKLFKSVADASKETGIDRKCIRDAANGKQKTAGGYYWKFSEDKQVTIFEEVTQ